ncbi:MAG: Na+/H+ antiporter NhaA [Geminicoccaceae bacterium]
MASGGQPSTSSRMARQNNVPAQVIISMTTPWQQFMRMESSAGVALIVMALLAFAWANSPFAESYFAMKEATFGFQLGGFELKKDLAHWVNDGLMAIFFFVVGLEIKRELLVGELAGVKRAAFPAAGALGGMIVPALIYVAFTFGTEGISGWGVPMATDIAFAVGILALLGERAPLGLKVFLLALAIVDDLGAIMVIALFYTADLQMNMLIISFAIWGAALFYGAAGGTKPVVFVALGAVVWYFMLKSGVHATIAGVLMAIAVPLHHGMSGKELREHLDNCVTHGGFEHLEMQIQRLDDILDLAHSPLHRMEHALLPWVSYFIMPLFALFNAGVQVFGAEGQLLGLISLGAAFGLLIGKPVGVFLFAFAAVKLGITQLPRGVDWAGIVGVGFLAGIGFTMSLFIAELAFATPAQLDQAKIGVLCASVISAIVGYGYLQTVLRVKDEAETAPAGKISAPKPAE